MEIKSNVDARLDTERKAPVITTGLKMTGTNHLLANRFAKCRCFHFDW